MKKTLLLAGLALSFLIGSCDDPDETATAEFAQCLTDADFVMYGTNDCPACQQQMSLFGEAAAELNYVNCYLPSGDYNGACQAAGVVYVPTWTFPPNKFVIGVQTLERLAKLSGCDL